jgi:hypothetical protein
MYEYDNGHWMENFRLTKKNVFQILDILSPHIQKRNTSFRNAIPATMKVAVTLYKLCQGASFLICSK